MTRIARTAVALLALGTTAAAFTACDPGPNCTNIKQQYADAPVKNISRANAEKAVFCLTNDQRAANGVAALTLSGKLGTAARNHANDAVARKWWVGGADPHVNPDGKTPTDRMRATGWCPSPTFFKTAENVYWGWGTPLQTPRHAVNWWMGSPGHRANILDPDMKELGVGVALGAPQPGAFPNAAVFVQNFGLCR